MSALLECEGVSAGYHGRPVVSDVSLSIDPGEVVALLGPNGGGKSTLMKTLGGIVPTIAGKIRIQSAVLDSLSPREVAQRIGFVPQEEVCPFDFTVDEVVTMGRLPLSNGFFDTAEDKEAAKQAMEQAGCYDLRNRPVTELSGGEKQRVLIARALAQQTPVLFLDEPTSHLDPKYQVSITGLVRDMAASGKGLLVALHDLAIAGIMADRGLLIANARASATEPISELLRSETLDKAYGAAFDRVVTPDGRLVVAAKAREGL